MDILYRKAIKKDKKNLYDMGVALNTYYSTFAEAPKNIFWEGWETDMADEVDEELSNPTKQVYIAEDSDKNPAGYLIAINCNCCDRFEIDQLYVKEEFRGQRVGKGLMDLAIKEGSKGHNTISLEVFKSNVSTIKFYEKYGFNDEGLVMKMDLDI